MLDLREQLLIPERLQGMTPPNAGTMSEEMQSSLYQLFSEAQLYDECQIYGAAPLCEENLPCSDWFSYGVNDYSSMADGSEICDSHSQPLSSYGGSEGCSEASSPASPVSTDSFFSQQTSPAPSLSCFPSYASSGTPATSAYSSPDATASQEVASPTDSLT